jgi:hypothetical protein
MVIRLKRRACPKLGKIVGKFHDGQGKEKAGQGRQGRVEKGQAKVRRIRRVTQ